MNNIEGLVDQFRLAHYDTLHIVITLEVDKWNVLDLSFENIGFSVVVNHHDIFVPILVVLGEICMLAT